MPTYTNNLTGSDRPTVIDDLPGKAKPLAWGEGGITVGHENLLGSERMQ